LDVPKPSWEKIFMIVFEFNEHFFFLKHHHLKLQEVFTELGIKVEKGLENFQTFLILEISDKPEMLEII
jgi:hypothetical protein